MNDGTEPDRSSNDAVSDEPVFDDAESGGLTRRDRANVRRYTWQIAAASALYLLVTVLPPFLVEQGTPAAVVFALLPILPVVWMVLTLLQFLRALDEYQRPRLVRAFALAFGVSMLTALIVGMIENAIGGLPHAVWIVFIAGMMTWLIASLVISARDSR